MQKGTLLRIAFPLILFYMKILKIELQYSNLEDERIWRYSPYLCLRYYYVDSNLCLVAVGTCKLY